MKSSKAAIIGLYILSFFAANTLVSCIGGFLQELAHNELSLMHGGVRSGCGPLLCGV